MTTAQVASTLALFGLIAAGSVAQSDNAGVGPRDPQWEKHRATKVLYAGKAGGHREKAFAAFLGEWFDESSTLPLEDLSMKSAADYDVVIVDWVSQYGNDGYEARENRLFSAPIDLGRDFTKPFVTMSYISSNVRPHGKLDWL